MLCTLLMFSSLNLTIEYAFAWQACHTIYDMLRIVLQSLESNTNIFKISKYLFNLLKKHSHLHSVTR